ncbi:MAG: radical SAM protein [Bacteroidales bacterium]|nr:radical SAM protein [Bacteroidales bacterium]
MKVNEIFYSLQGEGYHSGTPAVFVRFSGCNLQCPFCDTQHSSGTEMTEDDIAAAVGGYPARMVVVTGGEPALQLTSSLVDKLHLLGKYVAVETNGTRRLPENVDWITLSPKDMWLGENARPVLARADELKLLFEEGLPVEDYENILVAHRFLQPVDTDDQRQNDANKNAAIAYIKQHPQWRLSLQIHKLLGIR